MLGPDLLAHLGRFAFGFGLNPVQPGNVAQGAGGNRALIGFGEVEEFAPRMGHAAEFDDAPVPKQGLVSGVVVDHEVAPPAA